MSSVLEMCRWDNIYWCVIRSWLLWKSGRVHCPDIHISNKQIMLNLISNFLLISQPSTTQISSILPHLSCAVLCWCTLGHLSRLHLYPPLIFLMSHPAPCFSVCFFQLLIFLSCTHFSASAWCWKGLVLPCLISQNCSLPAQFTFHPHQKHFLSYASCHTFSSCVTTLTRYKKTGFDLKMMS